MEQSQRTFSMPDPGLLKAFPILALSHFKCPKCKELIPSSNMIVNGRRSGYVECKCGHVFDPEIIEVAP